MTPEQRPTPIPLAAGEVHVWQAALDVGAAEGERLARMLSPAEARRALRLRTGLARRRFVAARGILRAILGRYLAAPPSALRFETDARGKPALIGSGAPSPHFNVSHSESMALYAVCATGPVGVDVERVRPDFDWSGPAAHFFTPRELAELRDLTPADRRAGFFSCWTRKEAFLKARGDGLLAPLDAFDVTVGPAAAAGLLAVRDALADGRLWWLMDCDPAPDYVAAVAGEGRLEHLEHLEWHR